MAGVGAALAQALPGIISSIAKTTADMIVLANKDDEFDSPTQFNNGVANLSLDPLRQNEEEDAETAKKLAGDNKAQFAQNEKERVKFQEEYNTRLAKAEEVVDDTRNFGLAGKAVVAEKIQSASELKGIYNQALANNKGDRDVALGAVHAHLDNKKKNGEELTEQQKEISGLLFKPTKNGEALTADDGQPLGAPRNFQLLGNVKAKLKSLGGDESKLSKSERDFLGAESKLAKSKRELYDLKVKHGVSKGNQVLDKNKPSLAQRTKMAERIVANRRKASKNQEAGRKIDLSAGNVPAQATKFHNGTKPLGLF